MKATIFYTGFGLQIAGIVLVGLCLLRGLDMGDYGRAELVQFLGGASIFYLGHFFRSRK